MRFIYTDFYFYEMFDGYDVWEWDSNCKPYELEDTLLEIIWLINSQEAYEEMREYYVKC